MDCPWFKDSNVSSAIGMETSRWGSDSRRTQRPAEIRSKRISEIVKLVENSLSHLTRPLRYGKP